MWHSLLGLILLGVGGFVSDSLWVRSSHVLLPCPWRESVQVQGARVAGWRGDTLLLASFAAESAKVVFLRWQPCRDHRNRQTPVGSPSGDHSQPSPRLQPKETLLLQGFKSFTVTGGPGTSARFQQATQVQFQGVLGPYRVSGVLSDQNLSATGVEELGAVDRVLFSLQGGGWVVHLGDLDLLTRTTELRGRGGALRWTQPRGSVEAAYALRRGDPQVVEISLQDGYAGPYFLDPEGRPVRVLPGSERVYLNGERLRPGPHGDYLLDYRTGTLVFTPGRRIQHTDHLRVEFERLQALPGHTTAVVEATAADSLWRLGWVQDGYSLGALRTYLSQADMERLASLGDTSGLVVLEGGLYVGEGRGEYLRQDSVFQYVGPGQGDFQVFFEFVGEGQGDYEYDALLGGYRFVGRRRGRYLPRLRQTVPSKIQLLELQTQPQWNSGRLQARLMAEELQRNVLLNRKHREMAGELRLQHRWTAWPWQPVVQVYGFQASSRFHRPQGARIPLDLTRRFRLSGQEPGRVQAGGVAVDLRFRPGWALHTEGFQMLLKGQRGSYSAWQAEARWSLGTLRTFGEVLQAPWGNRQRWGGSWTWHHWLGNPTLQALELHEDSAAYRELGFRWTPEHRRLELYGRRPLRHRQTQLWLLLDWPMPWAHLHPQMQVFWEPSAWAFLAQADWHHGPLRGHHELGRGALPGEGVRYVYVGPGNGDYAFDPETGEYHPDPQGEYRRETVDLGTLEGAAVQRHRLEGQWLRGGVQHRWTVDWQHTQGEHQQQERWWIEYTGGWKPWSWQAQYRSEQHPGFRDRWLLTQGLYRWSSQWQATAALEDRQTQGTYTTLQRHQTPWLALGHRWGKALEGELRVRYDRVWPTQGGMYQNPRVELRLRPTWSLSLGLRLQGSLTLGYGWVQGPLPTEASAVVLNLEPGGYLWYRFQLHRSIGNRTTLSLTATGDRRALEPLRHFFSASLNWVF